MNFDIINVLAFISSLVIIYMVIKMTKDMLAFKRQHSSVNRIDQGDATKSEYNQILKSTYWLEHERQTNMGEHFEDESVYLNRAQTIRNNTSFFSLVNE